MRWSAIHSISFPVTGISSANIEHLQDTPHTHSRELCLQNGLEFTETSTNSKILQKSEIDTTTLIKRKTLHVRVRAIIAFLAFLVPRGWTRTKEREHPLEPPTIHVDVLSVVADLTISVSRNLPSAAIVQPLQIPIASLALHSTTIYHATSKRRFNQFCR
jgi:hypothetical protein